MFDKRKAMQVNARKTHCKRGHPLSGENLAIGTNGSRQCRACAKIRREGRNKNSA